MSCFSGSEVKKRYLSRLIGLLAFAIIFCAIPQEVEAQSAVVAKFSGKAKKLRIRARTQIVKAMADQGIKLISYKQYLRKAKRNRIRGNRALRAKSIRKIAKQMKLDAVVTGAAIKKGRRFVVVVNVYDSRGKRILKKAYRLKRQAFPPVTANKLAVLISERLGGGGSVATAPPEPPPEPPPEVEDPKTDTGDGSTGTKDAFLPPWARTEKKTASTTTETADTSASSGTETEVTETAPKLKTKKKGKYGSVPDILIAAGMSGNIRAGVHPRHESGIYPGVRVDGRFFMGSFLDITGVKDIGLGGMFNMGLALKYGLDGSDEDWSSSMMQWQAELNYRLAINDVTLAPAFVFRVGYGSTSCTIDTTNAAAVSAAYTYPYGAVDIYLMLYEPYVRLFVSGGFLFTVAGGEDIDGSGMGFTVRGGLDLNLFSNLHISGGYEMWQFFGIEVAAVETSDTYQTFFLRVGWNYH